MKSLGQLWAAARRNPAAGGGFLTDALLQNGGNGGYAIRPDARGRGLGKAFLPLLVAEGKKLGIDRFLLTVCNDHEPSIRVALASGGKIEKVMTEKHYIWIEI